MVRIRDGRRAIASGCAPTAAGGQRSLQREDAVPGQMLDGQQTPSQKFPCDGTGSIRRFIVDQDDVDAVIDESAQAASDMEFFIANADDSGN